MADLFNDDPEPVFEPRRDDVPVAPDGAGVDLVRIFEAAQHRCHAVGALTDLVSDPLGIKPIQDLAVVPEVLARLYSPEPQTRLQSAIPFKASRKAPRHAA